MDMINLEHHFSLICSDQVINICKPLEKIGITYFNYVRLHHNSGVTTLTTCPEWTKLFFEEKLYETAVIVDIRSLKYGDFFLWNDYESDPAFAISKEAFKIGNGVTIVEESKEYCEFYYFASTPQNSSIINFYIKNIDLLYKFILYFKDKAYDLITAADRNQIFIPHKKISEAEKYESIRNEFLKQIHVERYFINNIPGLKYLTSREAECLYYYLQGKSAKQIGSSLSLSFRTVEAYLATVKGKLLCNTKNDLKKISQVLNIDKILENAFN